MMKDINLQGFDSIKADKGLVTMTKQRIITGTSNKPVWNLKKTIITVVTLFALFSGYKLFISNETFQTSPQNDGPTFTEDGGLHIPAIDLPEKTASESADMIGLIVYNGKIYTQTSTEITTENAESLLGEKLGTTKGNLDEWSTQDEYAEEFASSIGKTDVYAVKGYDKDFRIMTYSKRDGNVYAEVFECINGLTIYDGNDLFSKLKMVGNVESAQYRSHSDWEQGIENYIDFDNNKLLNKFVTELNHTTPILYESVKDAIGEFRNDESYRRLMLHLNDGTKVSLTLIKGGYIYYGYTSVYFKMENDVFREVWNQLDIS